MGSGPRQANIQWRKSSYSNNDSGLCVEIAQLPAGGVAVRDSKDPDGPRLAFPAASFAQLIRTVSLGD